MCCAVLCPRVCAEEGQPRSMCKHQNALFGGKINVICPWHSAWGRVVLTARAQGAGKGQGGHLQQSRLQSGHADLYSPYTRRGRFGFRGAFQGLAQRFVGLREDAGSRHRHLTYILAASTVHQHRLEDSRCGTAVLVLLLPKQPGDAMGLWARANCCTSISNGTLPCLCCRSHS
jgi:hypothetical protein